MDQQARTAVFCFLFLLAAPAYATNGADYRARYNIPNANAKLVDNQGNGFDPLYGVRNFRSVLNGVYYRGGANNYYNKHLKRDNQNPLPDEGLTNLCEEGFSTAIYLYDTRYSTAPHQVSCRMANGQSNQLEYKQLSILSASNTELQSLLQSMLDHVRNPALGPIYSHCWNGWHASGLTAAYTLRQFCGFTGDEAVQYWNSNTDGTMARATKAFALAFAPFSRLPEWT